MRYNERGLTKKEQEILDYIIKFKTINGLAPTISEIADGLYTSRSYVRTALYELVDKNFLKYDANRRRSIIVCKFDN